MTISCHQKTPAFFYRSADCRKQTRGTSIYQKIAFICAKGLCCPLLCFQQNSFRMMQVVKPGNLCNVNCFTIPVSHPLALVPRHMKRIRIRIAIFQQCLIQILFIFYCFITQLIWCCCLHWCPLFSPI